MTQFGPLVSTEWLASHIGGAGVKIIDGSWRMPGARRARDDYDRRHLEGAVFFDIDAITDQRSPLPHMLPSPPQFEADVGALGITHDDKVIVYDDQGLFSAARVWWSFRAMGHRHVAVLNGGLPKWEAENRPLSDQKTPITPAYYRANLNPQVIYSSDEVRAAMKGGRSLIVDARPAARFFGAAPEPRQGLRSGHMPGAKNLPVELLLNGNGTMRTPAEIKVIFENAGMAHDARIITTCGSGVTAAILSLALETIGHDRHSLYDGSWTEWGNENNDAKEFPVIG